MKTIYEGSSEDEVYRNEVTREMCERDHLFFTRYFFKARQSAKFIVNWHHKLIADAINDVIRGITKNLIINVAPGSSKTELVVINLIARGLALNPRARFLHLSYSDDLASLNSSTAKDLVLSDEFQAFWPMKISDDSKSKKRWNVEVDGKKAGGVYATSLAGQVTGFRAGHMEHGWNGAIILDDCLKAEDAFSPSKVDAANRRMLTTVKSRRASPNTPIIIIMQRIAENDLVGFIQKGNVPGDWKQIEIPALITEAEISRMPVAVQSIVKPEQRDDKGRFSYWQFKEPIEELLAMEAGLGKDLGGGRMSRFVFATQYQQRPTALGGNLIRGEWFIRYKILPKLKERQIFVDTAQKTKERNDFSVFQCWGLGEDNKIYLVDQIRGKWESPELKRRAVAFWKKHLATNVDQVGTLRSMKVEDKSSGTGLIQAIAAEEAIPVVGVERNKDKLTRVMDGQPYIEAKLVCVPEDAEYTNDFVAECESFSADMSHDHDDQVDPMLDAINDMLSTSNALRLWERLAG